ncbi:MAG: N-acetyltransferase [Anaerolineales bacterium]|nr:N-acetyltransferase [Anaerolineales bacterium]
MAIIRMAVPADADAMLEIYTPIVRNSCISFEEIPPSLKVFQQRIRETLRTHPWLVCENDTCILGYAYATPYRHRPAYRWTVETSVYIRPEFQRRGIARALYTSLLELLRMLGFHNAVAITALPNEASTKLHQTIGFELVGTLKAAGFKLDGWHDTALWQYTLLRSTTSPVSQPITLEETQESPEWKRALADGEKLLNI